MENVENLVRTTLEEIEKVLSTKTVVGEPITIEGRTLIPLISVAFGFGAGGGSGMGIDTKKQKGEGSGGGSGGGAGVKPVAIIIVEKDSVHVETIMGSMATAIERVGEAIPASLEKLLEKWWETRQEGQK